MSERHLIKILRYINLLIICMGRCLCVSYLISERHSKFELSVANLHTKLSNEIKAPCQKLTVFCRLFLQINNTYALQKTESFTGMQVYKGYSLSFRGKNPDIGRFFQFVHADEHICCVHFGTKQLVIDISSTISRSVALFYSGLYSETCRL